MHPSQLISAMAATGDGSRRSRTGGYHSSPGPTRQEREASWPSKEEFDRQDRKAWAVERPQFESMSLPTGVSPETMAGRDEEGRKVRLRGKAVDAHYRPGYPKGQGPQMDPIEYTTRPNIKMSRNERGEITVPRYQVGHIEDDPFDLHTRGPNVKLERGFDPLRGWMIGEKVAKANKLMKPPQPAGEFIQWDPTIDTGGGGWFGG